jgi:hypothetical protein
MRVYEPHTAAQPATGRMKLIQRAQAPESGDRRPLVSLNSSKLARCGAPPALPHCRTDLSTPPPGV